MPQYLFFLITLFHSYLADKFVLSFRKRHFFFTTWLVVAIAFLCCKVILWKNHRQSFFNQYGFIWLVTWSGSKRFWRKRIYRLKNCLLGIIIFYNKDHQLSIARSSSCSCWDHFSFLFESSLFELMTHIFLFFLISFFVFYFWFGNFWCAPFLLSLFLDLLSWIEFQHAEDPCLGYFWRKFLFFRLKEGAMEFYWCFRMNKHNHISFWIIIAWFLKRLTPATDFSNSQYLTFFFIVLSFA